MKSESHERLAALPGLPGAGVETFVLGEMLKHLAFSERRLTPFPFYAIP